LSEKRIVIAGDLVAEERKKLGQHVFVENGKIYSDCVGLVYAGKEIASVVPLHGKYIPRKGDLVVGAIVSETYSGYIVDINSIYYSYVSKERSRDRLKRGTIISAIVKDVNEINEAELDEVRVFYGGELMSTSPVKIPRVIGKNGSMLSELKSGTGCSMLVGRNGWIWAKGGNIGLLAEAIGLIEREAHLSNLTNKVGEFLRKKRVKNNA
jgi:exosome complex component RRP4